MEAKLKGPGEILYHIHHNDWKGGIQLVQYGKPGSVGGAIRASFDPKWIPAVKPASLGKDDWFTLEVISDGPRLITKINNVITADVTLTAEQQKKWYKQGVISIGAGTNGEWTIRKIEIKELGESPARAAWSVVDSHKDSKVEHQDQRVTFTLPGKFRYMIATEFNRTTDAPRLMQTVEGDFDLQAKLMPLPKLPGNPSSGGGYGSIAAGLLLWLDDENFVTLFQTKSGNSDKGFVVVQGARDGKHYKLTPKFKSHPLADPMKPVYLRAERRGTQVRGFVSEDGVKWALIAEVTTEFPARISAGVCASINQTTGATVELSELSLKSVASVP
jgi:hypothetical protein